MNFALLWIDALVIALLWLMAAAAVACRIKRKTLRWILWPIAIVIPLVILGSFTAGTAAVKFYSRVENSWFGYAASLMVCFVVGMILILRIAFRRGSDGKPAASNWRRGPLMMGCLFSIGIGYMTLTNMDTALQARCAIIGTQLNTLYIAMSPAIISDSQNAATLYEEAARRIQIDGHEPEINNPPTGSGVVFDPNEPATISFLARQQPTISLLRRAAAMLGCRFDEDVRDLNLSVNLTGLNEARNLANVLDLDAREEISRGHASVAINDAMAILQMSRHFARRPLLVSSLVGMGIDGLGNKALQSALSIVSRKEELNGLHLDALSPIGRSFQQSLWGEERFGLLRYSLMPGNTDLAAKVVPIDTTFLSQSATAASLFRVFYLDLDAYLRLMSNEQECAVQPYFQIRDRLLDPDGSHHFSDLMTSILGPSLKGTFVIAANVDALDKCAETAVAMTRFRLEHGSFPNSLGALIPAYLEAIPIDPFDGHPIRLVVRDNQWIIYSVGRNAADDGGVEYVNRPDKGDLIFTLKANAASAR